MRILLFACSEGAIIDQNSNRASLFNIMEEVSAPAFPTMLPAVAIFTLWQRQPGEADAAAQVTIRLDDTPLLQSPMAVTFQEFNHCRSVANIVGMLIPRPGKLRFEIRIGNEVMGTWETRVLQVQQPVGALTMTPALN